MNSLQQAPRALVVCAALSLFLVSRSAHGALVIADSLLVELDAAGTGAGSASWTNTGTLGGSFTEVGDVIPTFLGPNSNDALDFDGTDAYRGFPSPGSITGNATRSIEVWTYNAALNPEETLVSWGRRGGPDGSNMAFNYGSNAGFGAVGHWGGAFDMGWSGNPAVGQWHHLVYTYDGATASLRRWRP